MSEATIIPAATGTLALRVLDEEHCVRVTTVVAWRIVSAQDGTRTEVYPIEMPYGPLEDRGLPDAIIEPDNRVTHRPGGGRRAQQAVEWHLSGYCVGLTLSKVGGTLPNANKKLKRMCGLAT
ncbi:TPA: hypothetical protein QDC27_003235 [Burkholderia cepacia ATCC 25416]|uniref:hypothetical protein n=1 Tax=Burkholderia TaxID=32008 RepID=UPI000B7A3B15|nr:MULTISPECIES: hypothetical protein [Burkholderia]HDR9767885.1 hypothetical protein [Burkholderia cepacia ATCC 25416]MBJ9691550.1 hypothetical protein [Burkholderia cenocepacia]OXI24105.1 hypothetical protein CFB43_05115 [Burkholderia sp. AU15512]HDR9775440.1 hypothetical protein [Burkholderia cepacia ATCC 25416]HDR9784042.1 hypothetical protein [Burkholderia cepacia ATCC 25416]